MESHPLDEQLYMDNQLAPVVCSLPFGQSTVGKAGCELIACYNALLFCGRSVPFPALLEQAVRQRLLWRRGKWGMRPRQMQKLLSFRGLRAVFFFRGYAALEKKCRTGDAVILTTWNRKWWQYGLHSYLCIRKETGWLCLNHRHRTLLPTLREAARGRRLFSALFIPHRFR